MTEHEERDRQRELAAHKLPTMPMRTMLHNSMKQRGQLWANDVRVDLHEGLLRVTHLWHRFHTWAAAESGAIGEIGFAVTRDGAEHIVWRSAFGNPVGNSNADDSQPWRKAETPHQALALLMESVGRQVMPGDERRVYEAGIFKAHWDNRNRRLEKHMARLSRQVYFCMTHGNSVRVPTKDDRSFFDPVTGGAAQAVAGRHEIKWIGDMYHTEPMEYNSQTIAGVLKGTHIMSWYGDQHWDLRYIRKRSFAVFVCHSAREYSVVYGDAVPEYVKPAVEFTRGKINWVPQLNKANEAAYHTAINSHLHRTTMPNQVLTYRLVNPPREFNSRMNVLLDPLD